MQHPESSAFKGLNCLPYKPRPLSRNRVGSTIPQSSKVPPPPALAKEGGNQMGLGQWDRHHHKSPSEKWLILGTDTQVTYSSPFRNGEPIKTMTGKNPSQDVNCKIDYT